MNPHEGTHAGGRAVRAALAAALLGLAGVAALVDPAPQSVAPSAAARPADWSSPGWSRLGGRETLARRPDIAERPIPFGAKRKRQTRRYAERHYGLSTWRLHEPKVIVEHMAATNSYDSVYRTFASNEPDVEFGERPGVCAHFLVRGDGELVQFVRTGIICRHTVGLNYTAIGIEHLGTDAREVLRDDARLRRSLHLTNWLRCRFGIRVRNVIGHNENLDSPFYVEHDPDFRGQTHADWPQRHMDDYRHKLRNWRC